MFADRFLKLKSNSNSRFSCALFLLACLAFDLSAADAKTQYKYVIDVESSNHQAKLPSHKKLKVGKKFTIYSVKVKDKGKTWYKTRLGFFQSRRQADKHIKTIRAKYKGAWVDKVKSYDQAALANWLNKSAGDNKTSDSRFQDSPQKTEALLEEARVHMANNRFNKAIRIYTRILSRGAKQYHQTAQEYLGVAREKNNQYTHAKAEYREYLRLYPKGEGAERVRQRMAGILTARNRPKRKLKSREKKRPTHWEFYGSVYEFMRSERRESNALTTDYASLSSNLSLISRRRSDSSDIKMQFVGSYLYDLHDPSEENDGRISTMFVDVADRPKSMSARLGRQTRNTSGVLGRMDGLWVEYRVAPEWKVNAVAGYPVQSSITNRMQTNRPFYGLSLDLGTFMKYWDFNVFVYNQEMDGIIDREAVGGEIRYISKKEIYYTLLDYDQSFGELNKLYFVGTWFLEKDRSVNLTVNYGKSPYLMTSNALQGQVYSSLQEMMTVGGYSETEVRQIASDRTADFHSVTVSGTMPVSKVFNLAADVTISNLSGTPASGGITATPSTGDEYYYGVQLIGTDVITKYDTFVAGVAFSDTSTSERNKIFVNERFKLNKKWRLNPKFALENTSRSSGPDTISLRPAIKVDYTHKRNIRFDVEFQYEKNDTTGGPLNVSETVYLINAGLLVDF